MMHNITQKKWLSRIELNFSVHLSGSQLLTDLLAWLVGSLQGEALWIATNVTGILPLSVSAPFAHDLVPLAASALDPSSNDHAIIKQAAWLIANVAAVLDDDDGIDGESATAAQQLRQMVVGDQVLVARQSVCVGFSTLRMRRSIPLHSIPFHRCPVSSGRFYAL